MELYYILMPKIPETASDLSKLQQMCCSNKDVAGKNTIGSSFFLYLYVYLYILIQYTYIYILIQRIYIYSLPIS